MAKKIGYIVVTWFAVVFVYIILTAAMPGITAVTGEASTLLQSTSNMTNYPGSLEVVESAPMWVWFIPGGVGIAATAVFLRQDR